MARHLYHAPSDCPVCGDELIITRKGCLNCGTELAGEFASCPYCALDDADNDLLRVFLTSRGNLREVEKHLGVSYPTARARFDAVIAKLGLTPTSDTPADAEPAPGTADESAAQEQVQDQEQEQEQVPGQVPPSEYGTPQEQILARVASGELSSEVAAQLLAAL